MQPVPHDKSAPVTTAWRILRLRMEKRPPIWRVTANISNKQSRTAEKRWSSSLGVGRGAKNYSLLKTYPDTKCLQATRAWTDTDWYELRNGKGPWDLVIGMSGVCRGQVHSQQQPGNKQAQERERWRALVNAVMKLRVP